MINWLSNINCISRILESHFLNKITPLFFASVKGYFKIVKLLIEKGHIDIAKLLIENWAEVNIIAESLGTFYIKSMKYFVFHYQVTYSHICPWKSLHHFRNNIKPEIWNNITTQWLTQHADLNWWLYIIFIIGLEVYTR